MKIAQMAPLAERVPPKKYGGTERMVHALTEELVRRGHEVTLFASGDSITSAKLVSVYPRGLREAKMPDLYGVNPWTLHAIGQLYERQNEFDIIHDHVAPLSLPTANMATTPTVITMHGPFSPINRKLFQAMKKPHVVSISHSQALTAADINHAGTIYNGLVMDAYPFSAQHEEYLLFVGRISMEKGVHLAIEVAEQLDMQLIIAAKLDNVDRPYFRDYVEPRLSERIRWIGEVDETERNDLMSKASCLLSPVTWREPFGLVLVEAMACGCPVVAFNRGSIPEIIKSGVTGFVVDDTESMINAVSSIGNIERAACRAHALENFNVRKMTDGYEEIFKKVLDAKHSSN